MRRFMLLILITLMLGLATSLGVAWVIAGLQPEWCGADRVRTDDVGQWSVSHWEGRGQSIWLGSTSRSSLEPKNGPSRELLPVSSVAPPRFPGDSFTEHAVGWPVRAWGAQWRAHPTGFGELGSDDLNGGLIVAPGRSYSALLGRGLLLPARMLPVRPSWLALAADVSFWTVVWLAIAALLTAPCSLLHLVRRKRNRCALCGYDRRGLDTEVCSECGAARGAQPPKFSSTLVASLSATLLLLLIGEAAVAVYVAGMHHGPHPIHLCARDGDLEGITRELAKGVAVDVRVDGKDHPAGTTPLMWAAAANQFEAAELLLREGAWVDAPHGPSETALYFAARSSAPAVLSALLGAGADLDAPANHEVLCAAVMAGETAGVQILIDAGADVKSTAGRSAMGAAISRNTDVLRLLMDAGADISNPAMTEWAATTGSAENLRLLLQRGAPPY